MKKTLSMSMGLAIVLSLVIVFQARHVEAVLLIQSDGPPFQSDPHRFANDGIIGIAARVVVGPNDVAINQIGTFGEVAQNHNMKWLIFNDVVGSNPLLETTTVAQTADEASQWFDSPVFGPFTLLAGQTYWIGAAVDTPLSLINSVERNTAATLVSNGGLTLPTGANANALAGRCKSLWLALCYDSY